MTTDLRYPIGPLKLKPEALTADERAICIRHISETPQKMMQAVAGLDDRKLDAPYREGGWTVRQVVHHVPDSHLNAYIRFKLAMTENAPKIKAYDEKLWAELPEARTAPIEMSLQLLHGLHQRWVCFLGTMKPGDFRRTFDHPERGLMTLDNILDLYAWHGQHHVAQITSLRKRMGW